MTLSSLNLDDDDEKSSEPQGADAAELNRRSNDRNPEFPLCREKSFEGLLGDFMKSAAPKKAGLRRKEEYVKPNSAPPERRCVGRTKSFEGCLQPQQSFLRGGRRPNPRPQETEE